jgi:hypothetical protein
MNRQTLLALVLWYATVGVFSESLGQSSNAPCAGLTEPMLLSPAGGGLPDVAIDRSGRSHVVWQGSDFFLWYAQIGPEGALTIPARKVYDTIRTAFPRIAVDAAGDAHIVTTTTGVPSSLIYLKISNGARVRLNAFTMLVPGVFDSESNYSASIDINPLTGLPVIASEMELSYSVPIGGFPVFRYNQEISIISLDAAGNPIRSSRWTAYYSRNNPAPTYRVQNPRVAVDSLGTTHCVWSHSDPSWVGSSIGYVHAGGNSWVEIANKRNVAALSGGPEIVRGESGKIEIVWSTTAGSVVWQEMDHNGLTVVDDFIVSQSAAQPSRPKIAAGYGNIFVGWTDRREGATSQIYSRSLLNPAMERNVTCSSSSALNHSFSARDRDSLAYVWQENRNGANQIFYRQQAPADCMEWKQPGKSGAYLDPSNWASGRAPTEADRLCLRDSRSIVDVTTINMLNFTGLGRVYGSSGIEVESGRWEFNVSAPVFQVVPNSDPNSGLVHVSAGAQLTLAGGGNMETPRLKLERGAVLGAKGGTLSVTGDLKLSSTDGVTVLLYPEANRSQSALLKVQKEFQAGGSLTLLPTPKYTPAPGDRFRLVEFDPGTKSVDEIYKNCIFKNYDPAISKELFWGLDFREENGKKFIEAIVLRTPILRSNGTATPLTPSSGKTGLILVTHGTSDQFDPAQPEKDLLGALTKEISRFIERYESADWQVVTLDWREYATRPVGDWFAKFESDFWYDPATSAQFGIGLGESLVHWLEVNEGFKFQKYHLLGHSSGSWLVNRMMQLLASSGTVHLTFFDAFTDPAKRFPCPSLIFCDRFSSTLGAGAGGDDFVEHYVDRNSRSSPPGTDDRLKFAVNFDVTAALISSPLFLNIPPLPPDYSGAHAWPIQWYFETVEMALKGRLLSNDLYSNGFAFSPEFLESTAVPQSRAGLLTIKKSLKPNDDLAINLVASLLRPLVQFVTSKDFFSNWESAVTGTYQRREDGSFEMIAASAPPARSVGLANVSNSQTQIASVTVPISIAYPLNGLQFDYQFSQPSNGVLSVYVDGQLARIVNQSMVGTNAASSGEITLGRVYEPGSHKVMFLLQPETIGPAGVILKNVQLGLDLRPVLQPAPRFLPGALEWSFTGIPGQSNYVVETSMNLESWLTVTNILGTNVPLRFQTPLPFPDQQRFYRLRIAP